MDNDKLRHILDSMSYSTANPPILRGLNILTSGAARAAPHGYVKRGTPVGKAIVNPLAAVSLRVGMDTLTFFNSSDDEIVIKVTRRRAKRSPTDKG